MPSRYDKKPKFKVVPCSICGKPVTVGIKTRKPQRCIGCGIQAATDAQIQMHNKSGPVYEKWQARMAGWAATKTWGTPPIVQENSPSSSDT